MQIQVTASDANNIICQATATPTQTVTIDRGVAGNGIVSIVPVTIGTLEYLRITYTNGTISDVGPITSTAYTATSPINIVGNTISLLTVPVNLGGTGATTAAAGIQNLLPSYTGNGNKRLGLNSGATALEWVADGGGTVTSVSGAGTVSGLTLTGTVTTSGSLTLGGTLNLSAYNGAGAFTTLSASGAVTLSGGTANGVAYLNGSKVLTTGSALTFDGTNFATTGSVTSAGLSDSGNLTFTGTGNRITGDFSNATIANRVAFQTSTVNGGTNISLIPNGTVGSGAGSAQIRLEDNTSISTGNGAFGGVLLVQDTDFRVQSTRAGTGTYLPMTFYTGGSERVRIDTSGNVGIGTSSPGFKLDLQGGRSVLSANSEQYALGLRYNAATNGVWLGSPSANAFAVYSFGGGEYMRIDSSGNVGIGTSSPRGVFDLVGTGSPVQRNWAYVAGGNVGGQNPVSAFGGGIAFGTNFSNGNSETNLVWGQSVGSQQYLSISKWTGSSVVEQMRIDSSGNLLVGTTANGDNNRVNIRQSAAASGLGVGAGTGSGLVNWYNNAGGYLASVTHSGATVTYGTGSDYRLKNITGPVTNSGAYIDSLNPVEGTWKADGSTFVGLIAHEVQEASRTPVATGTKDGEQMQGMDYSSAEIIANLIAEVKSLRQRLAAAGI